MIAAELSLHSDIDTMDIFASAKMGAGFRRDFSDSTKTTPCPSLPPLPLPQEKMLLQQSIKPQLVSGLPLATPARGECLGCRRLNCLQPLGFRQPWRDKTRNRVRGLGWWADVDGFVCPESPMGPSSESYRAVCFG